MFKDKMKAEDTVMHLDDIDEGRMPDSYGSLRKARRMSTGLHIYRCEHPTRTRVMCPHHKHFCYGEKQEFYDTTRIFFDCGTFIDYGYGYYEAPQLYRRIVIFKDESGYTAWVPRSGWEMLAREVPLNQARRVARMRLGQGGQIVDKTGEKNGQVK